MRARIQRHLCQTHDTIKESNHEREHYKQQQPQHQWWQPQMWIQGDAGKATATTTTTTTRQSQSQPWGNVATTMGRNRDNKSDQNREKMPKTEQPTTSMTPTTTRIHGNNNWELQQQQQGSKAHNNGHYDGEIMATMMENQQTTKGEQMKKHIYHNEEKQQNTTTNYKSHIDRMGKWQETTMPTTTGKLIAKRTTTNHNNDGNHNGWQWQ